MRARDTLADPGAQLERTSLAWTRTAVSAAASGALLVRAAVQDGLASLLAFGSAVLVAAVAVWLWASVRYSLAAGKPQGYLLAGHRATVVGLAALAATVSVVALVATVVRNWPW
ncbi:MAG: DUF202 domain-containing protein [Streptosporangiales bacterium]